jgi:hypothetical protein
LSLNRFCPIVYLHSQRGYFFFFNPLPLISFFHPPSEREKGDWQQHLLQGLFRIPRPIVVDPLLSTLQHNGDETW